MMITIHGFPAKTKYQDVKMLIKQECNINDFILDNLIIDSDGTKKVRIGLTDNTEGYKVMKCLDGYRMPGNFVLKAIPVGKAAENAVTITSSGELPPLRTYHQTGGRRRYIPPDETLDRVAILLSASRNDVKVELDDDSDSGMPLSRFKDVQIPQPHNETLTSSNNPETSNDATLASSFVPETTNELTAPSSIRESNSHVEESFTEQEESNQQIMPMEFFVINDNVESLEENNTQESSPIKEQTLAEQEQKSRILKNQALAAYFQAKAEKVRLENKKLQLEIELLKNNRTANVFNS